MGQLKKSILNSLIYWGGNLLTSRNKISHFWSPQKMIKKTAHDVKVKAYKLNKESRIVGKPRVLPVKNAEDEEVFASVQIIPIGTAKSYCFLCFFAPVYERVKYISDDDMVDLVNTHLEKCEKTETFRQNSPLTTEIVSVVKSFLEEEVVLITKFLLDNYMLAEAWQVGKFLLLKQKRGNLQKLYEMVVKKFDDPKTVYANLVCLRIIFPLLSSQSEEVMQKVVEFTKEFYAELETSSKVSHSKGST
eukprot:TRINITY_DN5553_c0_g2_i1.p1 TRINITY_DN5553_c0_g2~~TRINITY_DN5553_c0_g2_i1.p1  ORF type:complete len:247 (-),score=54.69 TRINITY_DN5553_c0_g2_i1:164-904(-)